MSHNRSLVSSTYEGAPSSTYEGVPAPVERLFSIAGKIFRPDKCSMKDKTFERLIMIKCNAKLASS